jgi:hypothetical protein
VAEMMMEDICRRPNRRPNRPVVVNVVVVVAIIIVVVTVARACVSFSFDKNDKNMYGKINRGRKIKNFS